MGTSFKIWGDKTGLPGRKPNAQRCYRDSHLLRMHTQACIPLLLQPQIQTGCGKALKEALIRQTKNFKLQIS
jgi:hypothetical protein